MATLWRKTDKRGKIDVMGFKCALPVSIVAAVMCLPPVASAQSKQIKDLGVGKLLVAPRDCPDPNFAKAVVLLVQFDEDGAVGLMINHRTNVPLSRALDQVKAATGRSDPIYLGGPVDVSTVMALLRTASKPNDARRVAGDVYLVSTRVLLEKTLAAGTGPGEFHAYVGYCGWGAGQLQNETNLGAWLIFEGSAKLAFDSDPESVWSRLIARTEQRVARGPAQPRSRQRGTSWKASLPFGTWCELFPFLAWLA